MAGSALKEEIEVRDYRFIVQNSLGCSTDGKANNFTDHLPECTLILFRRLFIVKNSLGCNTDGKGNKFTDHLPECTVISFRRGQQKMAREYAFTHAYTQLRDVGLI